MRIAQAPATTQTPTPADPAAAAKDAKLHKVAYQMEGAFVEQMYKSMRATVPTDGLFDGGSGEEMFTGLMDQKIASDTPLQWQHGLSEAVYRQLRSAIHQQQHAADPSSDGQTSSPTAPAGEP
jgi:flagellar protein FlgJ